MTNMIRQITFSEYNRQDDCAICAGSYIISSHYTSKHAVRKSSPCILESFLLPIFLSLLYRQRNADYRRLKNEKV